MSSRLLLVLTVIAPCAVAAAVYFRLARRATTETVHVENSFEFTIDAPIEIAAPLFGALKERDWAGKAWDPEFVYPRPARDAAGAVFTVTRSRLRAIWVNTAFALGAGNSHIQYVYVVPEVQAVLIDIQLKPAGAATLAHVVYQRTALDAKFNRHMVEMGDRDRGFGTEWQTQIDAYLRRRD